MISNECQQYITLRVKSVWIAFKHPQSTNVTTQLMVVTTLDFRQVSPILQTMKSVKMAFKHPQSPNVNARPNPIRGWWHRIISNDCQQYITRRVNSVWTTLKHPQSTNVTTQLMVGTPHDFRRVSPILLTMKSVKMAFKHHQSPNVNASRNPMGGW